MPKIYTDEFKQSALKLLGEGMTQKQGSAELGISKSALQTWVRDTRLLSEDSSWPGARGVTCSGGSAQAHPRA